MAEIVLTNGEIALISDQDYKTVSAYKWTVLNDKHNKYAISKIKIEDKWKTLYMHRLIIGETNLQIDHINHNGLDNQRDNLRVCTHLQNCMNKISYRGSSKFKGVSYNKKAKKYEAYININGTRKRLGLFISEIDAALAYNFEAKTNFKEYSFINNVS